MEPWAWGILGAWTSGVLSRLWILSNRTPLTPLLKLAGEARAQQESKPGRPQSPPWVWGTGLGGESRVPPAPRFLALFSRHGFQPRNVHMVPAAVLPWAPFPLLLEPLVSSQCRCQLVRVLECLAGRPAPATRRPGGTFTWFYTGTLFRVFVAGFIPVDDCPDR